jgi:hypothetical protein
MKLAAGAMALLLAGCVQAAQKPVPTTAAAVVTPQQLATPVTPTPEPTPDKASGMITSHRPALLEAIARFKNNMCINDDTGLRCTQSTLALQRRSAAAALDLEGSKPWPAEVEALANRTLVHLYAVEALTEGAGTMAQLDTQLTLLREDLKRWSPVLG